MGSLGTPELLIILVVVLLLFGGAKLPQLARSLGQAKQEFERGSRSESEKAADARAAVAPSPEPAPKPETVTMTREELEKLIDERARKVVPPPEDQR